MADEMKLRVGIVGLGESWEQRYRPALRALADRFEIRAVCDEVAIRAEQTARQLNVDAVDGFHALLHRADIDAVLLGGAAWFGWLPVVAACSARKAVFSDSSLFVCTDAALQLKQRIEDSGIAFVTEFPRRYAPATLRLKELIATRLGPPKMLFCHYRLPGSRHLHGFTGIDELLETKRSLIELVDWCCYVVGRKPTSVMGVVNQISDAHGGGYEMMSLQFEAGEADEPSVVAQISCGSYLPDAWHEATSFRPPAALQVCCANGVAFIDLPAQLVWFDEAGRHLESLESDRSIGEQLLLHFHRSTTSLVRSVADLHETYRALTIVTAARKSHLDNHHVRIDE